MKKNYLKIILVLALLFLGTNNTYAASMQFVSRQNNKYIMPGDELSIGSEHFYVVYSDYKTTKLLAKHNLNVGEFIDSSVQEGIQLTKDKEHIDTEFAPGPNIPYYGDVDFDSSFTNTTKFPWSSKIAGREDNCGIELFVYVYDNNVEISRYVESYVSTLKSMGLSNNITGKLLSRDDVYYYDSTISANKGRNDNRDTLETYDWFKTTDFWYGTAISPDEDGDWYVEASDTLIPYGAGSRGLRPVIEIPTSELDPNMDIIHYPRKVGEELTIGTESFYIIYSDFTKTVAFAKYNLNVGNHLLDGAKEGLQNKNILVNGGIGNDTGKVSFAKDKYWESNGRLYERTIDGVTYRTYVGGTNVSSDGSYYVYDSRSDISKYVDSYVSTLKSLGASSNTTGRLISRNELERLGFSPYCYDFKSAPKWLYYSGYWTGDGNNNGRVLSINVYSGIEPYASYQGVGSGTAVRPVIEIPTSELPGIKIPSTTNPGSNSGSNSGSGSKSNSDSSSGSKSNSDSNNGQSFIGNIVDTIAEEISENPDTGVVSIICVIILMASAFLSSYYLYTNKKKKTTSK